MESWNSLDGRDLKDHLIAPQTMAGTPEPQLPWKTCPIMEDFHHGKPSLRTSRDPRKGNPKMQEPGEHQGSLYIPNPTLRWILLLEPQPGMIKPNP